MKYGSVCSGIEAATAGWHSLGWEPAFFSEIEKFPRAVLKHHYPDVPLHGDFTTIGEDDYDAIDLLVGGTPCQSFSVAGLRGGLDDDRGNLALEFLRLAKRKRPKWIVWENVPGVLSSNEGRDFGSILGGLGELGYGFAYRVLDAQYFGVAQRRRRVFVVGYLGDWRCAAAVLFESQSLRGDSPPVRKSGKSSSTLTSRGTGGGDLGTDFECDGGLACEVADTLSVGANQTTGFVGDVVGTLDAHDGAKWGSDQWVDQDKAMVVGAITARGPGALGAPAIDADHVFCVASGQANAPIDEDVSGALTTINDPPIISHTLTSRYDSGSNGTDGGTPIVPTIAFKANAGTEFPCESEDSDLSPTLQAVNPMAVAFEPRHYTRGQGGAKGDEVTGALSAEAYGSSDKAPHVVYETPVDTTGHQGDRVVGDGDAHPALSAQGGNNGGGPGALVAHAVRTAQTSSNGCGINDETAYTLDQANGQAVSSGMAVRRLTPRECERLQGFPDDFTRIPWGKKPAEECPDGPRYRALGNSMAVPVMAWIGARINQVEKELEDE